MIGQLDRGGGGGSTDSTPTVTYDDGSNDTNDSGGGGGGLSDATDQLTQSSSSPSVTYDDGSDDRDTTTVQDESPYRLSDAENDVTRDTSTEVDVREESPHRLSDAENAIVNDDSSTEGYGPSDDSSGATIPDTSTLVEPPGSVPEPDPTEGNGQYTTDETIDITTTEDPDGNPYEQATTEAVEDTVDTVNDAADTAENTAENVTDEVMPEVEVDPSVELDAGDMAASLVVGIAAAGIGATLFGGDE